MGNAVGSGVLTTQKGVELLVQALNITLKAFGQKTLPVTAFKDIGSVTAWAKQWQKGSTQSMTKGHFAGGGIFQVGNAGERGGDSVPMNILVGRGEKVAVLNAEQQAVADAHFSRYGGFDGFFANVGRTPHYAQPRFAQGGYRGYSLPLPRGSMMPGSWSFDQGVDIPAGAGTPEFAIGPGTITQEGIGGFGPNAPILRLDAGAGPLGGMSFYYGHAGPDTVRVGQHVRAGQQISEVGSGIVGISSGPHIEFGIWPPQGGATVARLLNQLMGGAGVAGIPGGMGGGAVPVIPTPKIAGAGAIADISRAVMKAETKAANAYLAGHLPNVGMGMSPIAMPDAGGWQEALRKIAKDKGWSVADWMWLVQAESSGNPNAVNPSSGAFGLGQFLGSTAQEYAPYGALSHNPVAQIRAMAMYIQNSYGSPTKAKAFHLSHNWYGRGGVLEGSTGLTSLVPYSWTHLRHRRYPVGGHSRHAPSGGRGAKRPTRTGHGASPTELRELIGVGGTIAALETRRTKLINEFDAKSSRYSTDEGMAQYLNLDGSLNAAGIAKKVADDTDLLNIAWQIYGIYTGVPGKTKGEKTIVTAELQKWLSKRGKAEKLISKDDRLLRRNKLREEALRKTRTALEKPSKDVVGALEGTIHGTELHWSPIINRAVAAAARYHGKDKARRNALRDAVTAARQGRSNALYPLQRALLGAQAARRGHNFKVKSERHQIDMALQALTNQDTKISNKRADVRGLFGSQGPAGSGRIDQKISGLESVASNLGLVVWGPKGRFKYIDTTNQGAAYDQLTTIHGLQIALGQDQALKATPTMDQSQLASFWQQQALMAWQKSALQALQMRTLAGMPSYMAYQAPPFYTLASAPFAGAYQHGGIVPGPIGAPRTAIVHGGEKITPPDINSSVRVVLEDNRTRVLVDDVEQAMAVVNRKTGRAVGRGLPGVGGGLRI
jgi:murein DD-endopeptidase MepM/ murein hydrolase activator NlpD